MLFALDGFLSADELKTVQDQIAAKTLLFQESTLGVVPSAPSSWLQCMHTQQAQRVVDPSQRQSRVLDLDNVPAVIRILEAAWARVSANKSVDMLAFYRGLVEEACEHREEKTSWR